MCELVYLLLENERGVMRKGRTLQQLAGMPASRDSTLLGKTGMDMMEKTLAGNLGNAQDEALTTLGRSGLQLVLAIDDVNRAEFFFPFIFLIM
jgi:hypothetical protein